MVTLEKEERGNSPERRLLFRSLLSCQLYHHLLDEGSLVGFPRDVIAAECELCHGGAPISLSPFSSSDNPKAARRVEKYTLLSRAMRDQGWKDKRVAGATAISEPSHLRKTHL